MIVQKELYQPDPMPIYKTVFLYLLTQFMMQLCEEYGLLHISKGQGKERFIQVQRRDQSQEPHPSPPVVQEQLPHGGSHEEHMQQKCNYCNVCMIL